MKRPLSISIKPFFSTRIWYKLTAAGGAVKSALGNHEAAIADFDQAIYLKPDYVVAYCNRGIAKRKLEKYEEAIADYNQAIRLKSDHAEAYCNRGIARSYLGHKDEARDDFKVALDLAKKAGDDKLKAEVEQLLHALDEQLSTK